MKPSASKQPKEYQAWYRENVLDKEQVRLYQAKYRTAHKNQLAHRAKEVHARRRSIVADVKLMVGCVDCGYDKEACALDFDHTEDNKTGNVGHLVSAGSWARIWEEVMKCDVVCANCHRIRTYRRNNEHRHPRY